MNVKEEFYNKLQCKKTRWDIMERDKEDENLLNDVIEYLDIFFLKLKNAEETIPSQEMILDLSSFAKALSHLKGKNIPNDFIKKTSFVEVFLSLSYQNNDVELIEGCLLILEEIIYFSQFALDIFVQLNPVDFLFVVLSGTVGSELVIIVLGIFLKLVSSPQFHLEAQMIIQNLFNLSSSFVHMEQKNEILKIYFDILNAFIINTNDRGILEGYCAVILQNLVGYVQNPVFTAKILLVFFSVAKKGFCQLLFETGSYEMCNKLLIDEDFEPISHIIAKISVLLLCSNENMLQSIQLERFKAIFVRQIISKSEKTKIIKRQKKIIRNILKLFSEISSIGYLSLIIADSEVVESALAVILDGDDFKTKKMAYELLWSGFFSAKTVTEQISLMNMDIFTFMTTTEYQSTDIQIVAFSLFANVLNAVGQSSPGTLSDDALCRIKEFTKDCIDNNETEDTCNENYESKTELYQIACNFINEYFLNKGYII